MASVSRVVELLSKFGQGREKGGDRRGWGGDAPRALTHVPWHFCVPVDPLTKAADSQCTRQHGDVVGRRMGALVGIARMDALVGIARMDAGTEARRDRMRRCGEEGQDGGRNPMHR